MLSLEVFAGGRIAELLTSGLIMILRADGGIAGAGFLISADTAITCTHVLAPAGSPVPKEVFIRFYGVAAIHKAAVDAENCRPAEAEDIAFLTMVPSVVGKTPLPLGSSSGTNGHEFDTFGFPSVNTDGGIRGDGHVLGKAFINKIPVLQIDSKQVTPGFSGAPVLDKLTGRVIGMVTKIAVPDEYGRLRDVAFITPSESLRAVFPALQIEDACPYRGLTSFTSEPEDVKFFWGRERLTSDLVAHLSKNPSFLAVVGPSGSGKSSVVNAGLVPAIRAGQAGFAPERVLVFSLSKVSLDDVFAAANEIDNAAKNGSSVRRTVLVLDELEQFFVASSKARDSVIPLLVKLVKDRPGFTLLTAFRSDFYDPVFTSPFGPCLDNGQVNVRLMSLDELKSAIATPAASVGLWFSEGLVDDIAADAAKLDNPLPLLEFALTQLWEQRNDGELTRDAYRKMKGVAGSIVFWATDAFARLLEEERKTAQRILLRLIHYGDGITPDTRKRAPLADLVSGSQDQAQVLGVVMKLATSRILITDRDPSTKRQTVGLIHDALITQWEELAGWIKERRHFLEWRQRLGARVEEWEKSSRDEGGLLRGYALNDAVRWFTDRREDLNEAERRFVGESIERQSRLEDERREEERRQLNRTRRFAIFVSTAFLLALAATTVAIWQGIAARQQRDQATAAALATRASLLASGPGRLYQTALLVAMEALKRESSAQTDQAVHDIEAETPIFVKTMYHQGAVTSLAFGRDGSSLASGSEDGTARIWNLETGKSETVFHHPLPVSALIFDEKEGYLATGEGRVTSLNPIQSQPSPPSAFALSIWIRGKAWPSQPTYRSAFTHPVHDIATSNGVIAASDGETMRAFSLLPQVSVVWEAGDRDSNLYMLGTAKYVLGNEKKSTLQIGDAQKRQGTVRLPLPSAPTTRIRAILPLPDGSGFGAAECGARPVYLACEVEVWSLPHLEAAAKPIQPEIPGDHFAISPSGARIASVATIQNGTVEVWEWASGKRLGSVENGVSGDGPIMCCILSFSHNSEYLAVSSGDRCLTIYEVNPWRRVFRIGIDRDFTALAWSPDDQTIAAGTLDGRIDIWHLVQGGEAWHQSAWDFKYSPGGRYYVTSLVPPGRTMGPNGMSLSEMRATVYDSAGHEVASGLTGDCAFSSDDRYIASVSEKGDSVTVFDLAAGRFLAPIMPGGTIYSAVSFLKSSVWLFSFANGKGTLGEWNLNNSQKVREIWAGSFKEGVVSVASDGGTWAICPDCRQLESKQPGFDVLNLNQGRITARIPAAAFAMPFQISPDGRFAAGFAGKRVNVWETSQGKSLWNDDLGGWTSWSIAFSADGTKVATGSRSTLKVWQTQTGKVLLSVNDQTAEVGASNNDESFGFDPTGSYIAAIHHDGSIRIWRLSDAQPVSTIKASAWDHVFFTPDGSAVITQVRGPGLFRAFRWRPAEVLLDSCRHVANNLTREQWSNEIHAKEFRKTCPGKP